MRYRVKAGNLEEAEMAVQVTREYLLANGISADVLDRLLAAPDAARPPALVLPGQPTLGAVGNDLGIGPGRWSVEIFDWAPASKNVKARGWRAWHQARRRDDAVLDLWARHPDGPPPAAGKRRLSALVERRRARGRLPDPQNLVESLCDSCVATGLIVDDSSRWLEVVQPVVRVNREIGWAWVTTLILEDVSDGCI